MKKPGDREGRPYSVHEEVEFYACSTSGEAPSLVFPAAG
jgi:hypothetical protein